MGEENNHVSIRDYVERLLIEHTRQHNDERVAGERALDEYRKSLDHRLELLNELRADVTRDRSQFPTKPELNAVIDIVERERQQVRGELDDLRSTIDQWKGKQAAYAVVLSIAVILGAAVVSSVIYVVGSR